MYYDRQYYKQLDGSRRDTRGGNELDLPNESDLECLRSATLSLSFNPRLQISPRIVKKQADQLSQQCTG
ncbi:hypothetical protein JCM5350_002155 [Sporobolomyces pararoseus]